MYRIKWNLFWERQNKFKWLNRYFMFYWTVPDIYLTECRLFDDFDIDFRRTRFQIWFFQFASNVPYIYIKMVFADSTSIPFNFHENQDISRLVEATLIITRYLTNFPRAIKIIIPYQITAFAISANRLWMCSKGDKSIELSRLEIRESSWMGFLLLVSLMLRHA